MSRTRLETSLADIPLGAAVLVAVVSAPFMACAPAPDQPPGVVTVFCDTLMRPVMSEIMETFHRRHDAHVDVRYGSSLELLGEFSVNPEAVDLFLAGGSDYMDQAQSLGLVEDFVPLARAAPVLLVQGGNPAEIESLEDLTRAELRLGLADANATVMGRTLPRLFQTHGLNMDELAATIALWADTDLELGNAVRMRRIDAAIVWEPSARQFPQCEIVPIPFEDDMALDIAIGLSTQAGEVKAAREFISFLRGRAARTRFEQYYYNLAEPDAAP